MLIWGEHEAVYFCARDWTDSITLNGREKYVFAHAQIAGEGASSLY